MKNKTCLIVYIGNGYSENILHGSGEYRYSIDMTNCLQNHVANLIAPLQLMGFKSDIALITNKHKKYNEFKKKYGAINIEYDDLTQEDIDCLYHLYFSLRIPEGWGPGSFYCGGRMLKIREKMPEYDYYIFVRTDLLFKISIFDLNIDLNKINYLWIETESSYLKKGTDQIIEGLDDRIFWRDYNRVSGNSFSIVPKKYINPFISCMWADHCSLHLILKDFSPFISLNDINFMCGEKRCYSANSNYSTNPVYTFNKKILA